MSNIKDQIVIYDNKRGIFIDGEFISLDQIFWQIYKPLSYNALFNYICGPRGAGKTYGAKDYGIKHFIKTGKEFIYLRRYSKELKKVNTFFDDIRDDYPDRKLDVKNGCFYCDGELCGHSKILSTSKIDKSTPFPNVDLIFFDEFIIDKGVYHYLPNEVEYFLEFYETVARLRDVQVFFLSNAITITNPYFLYFDVKLPYGKDIHKRGEILIQYFVNKYLQKLKKESRFGSIIAGTDYGNYAINNEFLRDNDSFIEKKSGNCCFLFAFTYMDNTFGVWQNIKAGKMYVSFDYDKTRDIMYALTKQDHTPNTLLLTNIKNSVLFKRFLTQYSLGNVYFESQKIKNICYEVIKLANIK